MLIFYVKHFDIIFFVIENMTFFFQDTLLLYQERIPG